MNDLVSKDNILNKLMHYEGFTIKAFDIVSEVLEEMPPDFDINKLKCDIIDKSVCPDNALGYIKLKDLFSILDEMGA